MLHKRQADSCNRLDHLRLRFALQLKPRQNRSCLKLVTRHRGCSLMVIPGPSSLTITPRTVQTRSFKLPGPLLSR